MDDSPLRIRVERQEGIAVLTLARPASGNAIDMPFGEQLLAAAQQLEGDAQVRAVLLRAEGAQFCVGGDLQAMRVAADQAARYLRRLTECLHAGLAILARLDAPLIAAVNGTAAGAGLGLVLAADLAVAAEGAKFVSAYSAVGLTPDAGCTYHLPRVVGHHRAMELFLTNRVLRAPEALAWGLVNQVVTSAELDDTCLRLAQRLSAGPRAAHGALKRLLAASVPGFEAQLERESHAIAARGASAEAQEGIAAFLEKRAPRFAAF